MTRLKSIRLRLLVFWLAAALLFPGQLHAQDQTASRPHLFSSDLSLWGPATAPQNRDFGLGAVANVRWVLGMTKGVLPVFQLNLGVFADGAAPADPSILDPGLGVLGSLMLGLRLRPEALFSEPADFSSGLYLQIAAGFGTSGSRTRPSFEARVGYLFSVNDLRLGPTIAAQHVLEAETGVQQFSLVALSIGLELVIGDASALGSVVPTETRAAVGSREPGIVNDQCPEQAEDFDDFEDNDGCPEPDNDRDGLLDGDDSCPNEPEVANGHLDSDGCPDAQPAGPTESRPTESRPTESRPTETRPTETRPTETRPTETRPTETRPTETRPTETRPTETRPTETRPTETRPTETRPTETRPTETRPTETTADSDADGVPDGSDRCPTEAETENGERDDDGCPDTGGLFTIQENQIFLDEEVFFEPDRARVRTHARRILSALLNVAARHPEWQLNVQVLADQFGQELSQRRAENIAAVLVAGGMDAARATSVGVAADSPDASMLTTRHRHIRIAITTEGRAP